MTLLFVQLELPPKAFFACTYNTCASVVKLCVSACSHRTATRSVSGLQIGNLQALAQFLSNASKSLSGTLADILSPSRMIIFGTLLTTLNKPMFAASGYIYATFGTVITLYWVTAGAHPCFHVARYLELALLSHVPRQSVPAPT